MKKTISFLLAIASCVIVQAYDFSNNHSVMPTAIFCLNDGYVKTITEVTQTTDDNTGYAYMEGALGLQGVSSYFYAQLFWEQKWWDTPIFLHSELRSTLFDGIYDNTYYAGFALCQYFSKGFLAYEPMFRYNNTDKAGYQFSLVGGWDWKRFDLAHFTDIWGSRSAIHSIFMYNEARFYYKACKRIEVGVVETLSLGGGVDNSTFLGIKINL